MVKDLRHGASRRAPSPKLQPAVRAGRDGRQPQPPTRLGRLDRVHLLGVSPLRRRGQPPQPPPPPPSPPPRFPPDSSRLLPRPDGAAPRARGQRLPPNHTLGGINIAVWPIGPVARRSGMIFIRAASATTRSTRPSCASTSRTCCASASTSSGTSRAAARGPASCGRRATACSRTSSTPSERAPTEDVYLVPVSIVYDQLHEVGAMAAEERGGGQKGRRARWLVGYARRAEARRESVRFGEPVSLREPPRTRRGAADDDSSRPEGRVRGLPSDQPRDADHADRAGDAGAARRGGPRR